MNFNNVSDACRVSRCSERQGWFSKGRIRDEINAMKWGHRKLKEISKFSSDILILFSLPLKIKYSSHIELNQ